MKLVADQRFTTIYLPEDYFVFTENQSGELMRVETRRLSRKKVKKKKKLKDCFIFRLVASDKKLGATELSDSERGDFNLDRRVEQYRN